MGKRLMPSAVSRKREKEAAANVLSTFLFYENSFVLNSATGLFFRISPSAIFIFNKIASGASVRELLSAVQEHYQIGHNDAVRDVELLTNEMIALGILNRVSLKP